MTHLPRRTSTRTVRDLQREVDDIFDRFFGRTGGTGGTSPMWSPATDLVETDEAFGLRLDVPGISKDDVAITLQNNTLTVSGDRASNRRDESEEVVRVERAFGPFHRTVPLPKAADTETIEAACDDGVLTIHGPKAEDSTRRQIEIQ